MKKASKVPITLSIRCSKKYLYAQILCNRSGQVLISISTATCHAISLRRTTSASVYYLGVNFGLQAAKHGVKYANSALKNNRNSSLINSFMAGVRATGMHNF